MAASSRVCSQSKIMTFLSYFDKGLPLSRSISLVDKVPGSLTFSFEALTSLLLTVEIFDDIIRRGVWRVVTSPANYKLFCILFKMECYNTHLAGQWFSFLCCILMPPSWIKCPGLNLINIKGQCFKCQILVLKCHNITEDRIRHASGPVQHQCTSVT